MMIFTACSSSGNGAVATVDGVDITQEKFDTYYMVQRTQMVDQVGEEFLAEKIEGDKFNRTYGEALREDVLNMLVTHQVLLNAADEAGIDMSEMAQELLAQDKEFSGEENFNESLKQLGITEEEYLTIVEDTMTVEEYYRLKQSEIEISDEEVEAYYNEHKEDLTQVRASHILVDTEEEAINIIQRIEEGEEFEELAKELSQDPGSAVNGGDLNFFNKEMMVEPFGDVALGQEIGEISEPVETEFGYHIIKTTDKNETLDDVKDIIVEILQSEKLVDEVEKMEKDAKIKKHLDVTKEPESIKSRLESSQAVTEDELEMDSQLEEESDNVDVEETEESEDTQ